MIIKLSISLDNAVLEKIDAFAKENGLTRSGLVAVACNDYISARQKMPELLSSFKRLGDLADKYQKGEISEVEFSQSLKNL